MARLLVALVAVLALASPATAWWCDGHMIVAQIAKTLVKNSTLDLANKLIDIFSDEYTTSPDFVSAACWADDLKAAGVFTSAEWHYINLPVVRGLLLNGLPPIPTHGQVAWAITTNNGTLGSYYAKPTDKARAIRFVLHFVGDLHQPLHSATLFSQEFPPPSGDLGGNKFAIKGVPQPHLHQFYDSGAEQWANNWVRPLNNSAADWVYTWSQKLMQEFPQSYFADRLAIVDPYEWAAESRNISESFVYTIEPNTELTSTYITEAATVCRSQVAIAGYRLAQLLDAWADSVSY